MSNKAPDLPQPELSQPHRAGDTQAIPGGRITYLAPLPLSTGQPPLDISKAVSELNDTWLDFGGGWPNVFGWQIIISGWCGFVLLCLIGFPLISLALLPLDIVKSLYVGFFWSGILGGGSWAIIDVFGPLLGISGFKA